MSFRLSRTLFWSAAGAAAAALLGPPSLATPLTALAGVGVLAAYAVARLALRRDRLALRVEAGASEPARVDAVGLAELASRTGAALAAAQGFERAALDVAAVLRAELGARECCVHRVRAVTPPIVQLVTLATDGSAGVEHRVRLDRSPLGVALRDGRVTGGGDGAWAIPVRSGTQWALLLELGPLALHAAPGELEAFFEALAERLAGLASGPTGPAAAPALRDFLTPAGAHPNAVSGAEGGGCRTQYPATPDTLPALTAAIATDPPDRGADVLDAQALERLRELDPRGENQLVERVLRAFESSVARLLPQLESADAAGDRAGVRHVAHTLKSSSASIGAMRLSSHCASVEALIREGGTDEALKPPLALLRSELDHVLQAIRSMLDQPR